MSRILNVKLVLDSRGFEAAMNRVQNKIVAFGSKLENVGQSLTARVSLPLGLLGAAAIKASGDMQQLRLSMNAMSDNAEDAAKKFELLRKIALLPGIDLEQAIQGSIRLQSVGFSADEAAFSLQQLSKAVTLAGGSSQDLDEVTRQLTQILGKGKLLSEDIKVILSRVPALGIAFKDAFGTTSIEAIRKSGISVQEFSAKLIQAISQNEKFQKVQGGINNALVNFQSAIKQSLAALGDEIVATTRLDEILTALAGTIQGAIEGFKRLSPETKRVIVVAGLLATAIGPVLVGLGALIKLLPLVTTGIKAFGIAGLATTAVIGGITFAFFKLVDELGSVEQAIAFIQAKFTGAAAVIGEAITRVLNFASPGAKTAAQALGQSLGDVYQKAFTDSITSSAFAAGRKDSAALFEIPDAAKNFTNLLSQAGGAAIDIGGATGINGAGGPSKKEKDDVEEWWTQRQPELIKTGVDRIIANHEKQRAEVAKTALGYQTAGEYIAAAVTSIIPVQQPVLEQLDKFKVSAAELQERFQNIANVIAGPIQDGFSDFFDTLFSGGKNAFKAFGEAIKALIKRLLTAVATALALSAVFSLITGGAGSALSLLGGTGSGFGGLFKTLLKGGLGFAKGGLVTGPTAALIGEGPGTSRTNPEVVAPLDKLQGILQQSQAGAGFLATTRISGDDLLILVERAEKNRAR